MSLALQANAALQKRSLSSLDTRLCSPRFWQNHPKPSGVSEKYQHVGIKNPKFKHLEPKLMLPETQSTERRVTQKACDSLRHYIEAASQLWQSTTCLIKTSFNLSNSVVSGSDAIVILCCSTLANSHGTQTKNYVLWSKMPQVPTHAHAASYLCPRYIWSCRGEHETGDGKLVSLLLEAHISNHLKHLVMRDVQ